MIKADQRFAALGIIPLSPVTIRTVVGVIGFTAATAVAAHLRIPLPFSPVPITLQTAVVLLAGATLGASGGAASQVLWICAGLLGLPVFAQGMGFVGPTVGYIIGFVPAAMIVGLAVRRGFRIHSAVLGMLAATAVIYICGVGGLVATTSLTWSAAWRVGVLPFVAGDLLKLAAALGLSRLTIPLVGRG